MASPRRLARSLAFLTLFEIESRPSLSVEQTLLERSVVQTEETGQALGERSLEFAEHLVRGTLENREELDARIQQAAPAFPVDQLAVTDRVALELALYELQHEPATPLRVAINEAVELAKTYGSENSGRFVNGVLGTIAGELSAEQHDHNDDQQVRK
jgi:N utilization substance protein B